MEEEEGLTVRFPRLIDVEANAAATSDRVGPHRTVPFARSEVMARFIGLTGRCRGGRFSHHGVAGMPGHPLNQGVFGGAPHRTPDTTCPLGGRDMVSGKRDTGRTCRSPKSMRKRPCFVCWSGEVVAVGVGRFPRPPIDPGLG